MSIELHYLIFSILLGLVNLIGAAAVFTSQNGLLYAMGPRDEQKQLTGKAARVARSFQNFMETFVFFAAAVLIVQITGVHNAKTEFGAALYFWARCIYVPLYIFGIPGLRTLAWAGSIVGIVFILCSIFQ